ncbi:MAG: hypothetical protein VKL60_20820 [Sphaerospermopsis sp.]|nr:hypothetical protein [Sphaerospermopsis sp.]
MEALLLKHIAKCIQNGEISSFDELNAKLALFNLELKSTMQPDTHFAELLKGIEERKAKLN